MRCPTKRRTAASAEAAPWLDVLHFETRVDGQHRGYHKTFALGQDIPGASELGRGQDLVYQLCSTPDRQVGPGVAAGAHVVAMRATRPGTTRVLESRALEIELSCDDEPAAEDPPSTENPEHPDSGNEAGGCRASGGAAAPWLVLALLVLARRATVGSTPRRA